MLIPLLFMGDIVGRLFREFAVTLSVTIVVSAVVSLTLTPMMCAKLLRHKPESQQGRFYRASEHGFQWRSSTSTAETLRLVLRHQTGDAAGRRRRRWSLTILLYIDRSEGILPGSGHRRDPRHLRGAADAFRSPRWRSGSRRWRK